MPIGREDGDIVMSGVGKVDISKIKPGDKVTLVPLGVKAVLRGIDQIQLVDADGASIYFAFGQIAAHHPAPREFQVGDRVKSIHTDRDRGVIDHVARGKARVVWDKEDETLIDIKHLTLVEAGQ